MLLLLVACGDDIAGAPVVEHGLVCGAPGPHRVLELDADAVSDGDRSGVWLARPGP